MTATLIYGGIREKIEQVLPESPDQALSTHQIANLLGESTSNSNLGRINNACNTLRRFGTAAFRDVPQPKRGPMRHWYKVEASP